MTCGFISAISVLKKSSSQSVEDAEVKNLASKYMHVNRSVEDELRDILRSINTNHKKCLVLLCGSAGDGKSHILSYMKYIDEEHLLDDFEVYNDATESFAPDMTAIDALADKLKPFEDDNIGIDENKKLVVAINNGMLINFVDSEKGKKFSILRKYVEAQDVVSGHNRNTGYVQNSIIQHISFSDYQMFSLQQDGIKTEYLDKLLEKIFRKDDENPFYRAFNSNKECPMAKKCPIRMNYEYISNEKVQKAIINKIVSVVIKDKAIVSTREVLNFVYDLIVHPEFDYQKLCDSIASDINYISKCIPWTTPMLMNEFDDISPMIDAVKKHDILKIRHEEMDRKTTEFHAMDNIEEVYTTITRNTPYAPLSDLTDISVLGGMKPEIKKIVYKFLVRLQELNNERSYIIPERISEYLYYLYAQSIGEESNLAYLYSLTKKAVHLWEGRFVDGDLCIDSSNENYWMVEQIDLQPAIYGLKKIEEREIHRFTPYIKLKFKNESNISAGEAEILIDYSLFELLSNINAGYRPTAKDKNHHADFASFVSRIIELGNKKTKVIIISKTDKEKRYSFEKDPFGKYTFKVV